MMKLALIGGVLGVLGWHGLDLSNAVMSIIGLGVTLFVLALVLELAATILEKVARWPVGRKPDYHRQLSRNRSLF